MSSTEKSKIQMQRHLPLITPRVEFSPQPKLPPFAITPRIDFDIGPKRKKRIRSASPTIYRPIPRVHYSETSGMTVDNWETSPLIMKPSGEPGRPHSGGYNLEDTLAWPKDLYNALTVSLTPTKGPLLT